MLELSGVEAFYGHSRALQDISLSVGKGELLSVLGRNGVGKTTLLRAIMGLMDRTTGSIRLDSAEIGAARTDARARAGISVVPQGRGILPRFTVLENLRLGLFADARGTGVLDERVFETFPALREHLGRMGGNLSGGQQQQLALARALLANPKVILLDEPMAGVATGDVAGLVELIRLVHREQGRTVLMVEHHIDVVLGLADRVAVLHHGRLLACEPQAEVMADPLVQKAYLGRAA